MKPLLIVILLCLACSSSSNGGDASVDAAMDAASDVAGRAALELRVATWNIEQFPKAAGTVEAVRALIEEESLDLIGVQEIIDVAAFVDLAESLPDHDYELSFDSNAFLQHGILFRSGRVEVDSVERIFARDSRPFPRDPLVAQIRVRDDAGVERFDFAFVVVHLKAGQDSEDRERREEANVALEEWMRALVATQPDVVVVGDFNDLLTDMPAMNVFRPFLIDAESYQFLTLPAAIDGEHTFIPARIMLDHILVTSDALEEYGEGVTEILAIDERDPDYEPSVSDHRPVVATFRIP